MISRKYFWLGPPGVLICGLLLTLPAARSGGRPQSATILSTASNNGETSPCG